MTSASLWQSLRPASRLAILPVSPPGQFRTLPPRVDARLFKIPRSRRSSAKSSTGTKDPKTQNDRGGVCCNQSRGNWGPRDYLFCAKHLVVDCFEGVSPAFANASLGSTVSENPFGRIFLTAKALKLELVHAVP